MKTPFPGMDPYLEHPSLWGDVHDSLIGAIRDAIVPLVVPKYFVGLQRHAYLLLPGEKVLIGKPDVTIGTPLLPAGGGTVAAQSMVGALEVDVPLEEEIEENYLEVREVKSNRLVTVIEILSPVNKSHPEGREEYLEKRRQILHSRTSLVEIDLLRAGQPMTVYGVETHADYRILISPGWGRPRAQLFPFTLRDPIPDFPLPLLREDPAPLVPLNKILHELYTRARFDLRLDYHEPPIPKLSPEDTEWAAELLTHN